MTDHEIAAAYIAGATIAEIQSLAGVGSWRIKSALHRQGVTVRNHSARARQYRTCDTCLRSVDTPDKAYVLGLLATDGNVSLNSVRLEVAAYDEYLVRVFSSTLGGRASTLHSTEGDA